MASDTHKCPGPGCKRQVSGDMLACKRHWFQVSAGTRSRVWAAWKYGAGRGTPEHADAILAAIQEMRP